MADSLPVSQAKSSKTQRSWIAVLALTLLAVLFLRLGFWQLDRAHERREIASEIEAGQKAPPITINRDTQFGELQPWQALTATGFWLAQWSVLLDNRNLNGKPGYWLAMPLLIAPDQAVLVMRGWIARPIGQYNPLPTIELNTSQVTVSGELATRVPMLYEIAAGQSLPPTAAQLREVGNKISLNLDTLPIRQNLRVQELSEVSGVAFAPIVLLQTDSSEQGDFVQQWPKPSVDADKNVGYAIQWFGFAAIAFIAICVLLIRATRRAKIARN